MLTQKWKNNWHVLLIGVEICTVTPESNLEALSNFNTHVSFARTFHSWAN